MTVEEYLAMERASEIKHEFFDGEIFAMTGAKHNHNVIAANWVAELHRTLRQRASMCADFLRSNGLD